MATWGHVLLMYNNYSPEIVEVASHVFFSEPERKSLKWEKSAEFAWHPVYGGKVSGETNTRGHVYWTASRSCDTSSRLQLLSKRHQNKYSRGRLCHVFLYNMLYVSQMCIRVMLSCVLSLNTIRFWSMLPIFIWIVSPAMCQAYGRYITNDATLEIMGIYTTGNTSRTGNWTKIKQGETKLFVHLMGFTVWYDNGWVEKDL